MKIQIELEVPGTMPASGIHEAVQAIAEHGGGRG